MNRQTPLMPHLCVPTRPRALPESTLTVDGLRITVEKAEKRRATELRVERAAVAEE